MPRRAGTRQALRVLSLFPAALLSLIWQSQIDPRYRKMCKTLSFDIRNASLRFCTCHIKPSAARAAHFPLPSVGVPSRVDSQIHLKNSKLFVSSYTLRDDLLNFRLVLRNDMEGAPDRREKGRECVEQPMASDSQSKIVAQARVSALVS